jgi:hypothetical protein
MHNTIRNTIRKEKNKIEGSSADPEAAPPRIAAWREAKSMPSNSSSLPGRRVELITPPPARNPPRPARAWRIMSDIDLPARLPGLLRTSDWFGIAAIGFAATQVEVRIDPGISGIDYPPTGFSLIAGIPTLTVQRRALSGWGAPLKRAEDVVLTQPWPSAIPPGALGFQQQSHHDLQVSQHTS